MKLVNLLRLHADAARQTIKAALPPPVGQIIGSARRSRRLSVVIFATIAAATAAVVVLLLVDPTTDLTPTTGIPATQPPSSTVNSDNGDGSDAVPTSRDPILPIAALLNDIALDETQHLTKELGIQQCMNRRGWEYEPAPFFPTVSHVDRRYGIVDEQAAALYGYSPAPDDTDYSNPWFSEYYLNLSTADQIAFSDAMAGEGYGDGEIRRIYLDGVLIAEATTSSCETEGWEAAIGDQIAWIKLDRWLQNLRHESYSLAEADPRVQEARSQWRACMESEGQPVTSLTVPPFEVDNDAAVSDARCNNASGLAATWMQVESEFQYALIDEHGPTLGALLPTGLPHGNARNEFMAQCLTDRGTPAELTEGFVPMSQPPIGQEEAYPAAETECADLMESAFPSPSYTDPDQLVGLYLKLLATAECLKQEGYEPPKAPTLASFLDSQDEPWHPYATVSFATPEEWNRINSVCPQPG